MNDGVDPLGHGAIRFRHLGDLREQIDEAALKALIKEAVAANLKRRPA